MNRKKYYSDKHACRICNFNLKLEFESSHDVCKYKILLSTRVFVKIL